MGIKLAEKGKLEMAESQSSGAAFQIHGILNKYYSFTLFGIFMSMTPKNINPVQPKKY